ncbi:uncharacterized protein LOC127700241 [Mytilus californianus]|uniref:uncharacterized protein LOC127700241 n=1 Tax=Mytilus californianus TaxID=6549 RepID=UPI002248661B|nr:uncharacterized protein LOC127700241 [Mytilus californianus]
MKSEIYILAWMLISYTFSLNVYDKYKIGHRPVLLIEGDYVYLGGELGLVKLDKTSFNELKFISVQNVWAVLVDDDTNLLIVCSSLGDGESHCHKLTRNLKKKDKTSERFMVDLNTPPLYLKCRLSEKLGIIIAAPCIKSFTNRKDSKTIYSLQMGSLDEFSYSSTTVYHLIYKENKNRLQMRYKAGFVHQQFVYFLYNVYLKDQFIEAKLGKMCASHHTYSSNGFHTSYEDIPLVCYHDNVNYTKIEDGLVQNETIIVSFSNLKSSVICSLSIEELAKRFRDSRMNILRCNQKTGWKNRSLKPDPFSAWQSKTCIHLKNQTCDESMVCNVIKGDFCNTVLYHTIEGVHPIVSSAVYNTTGIILRHLSAVDSNDIVLIAGTNTGHIIKLNISSSESYTADVEYEITGSQNIVDLQTGNGTIYILTDTELQRISVDDSVFDNDCTNQRIGLKSWFNHIKPSIYICTIALLYIRSVLWNMF